MQRLNRNKGPILAALTAGILILTAARADITDDFAKSVAAAAATGKDHRNIPDHAVDGVMFPPRGRVVGIDGAVMMLAPGFKIRDLKNRIVLPSAIITPVNVRYTVDLYSQVHLIWLMPGEVKLDQKKQGHGGDH